MKSRLGAMSPKGATAAIPSAVEFPSQRRERIDWHKLAAVDLHELSSGCSMEVLQENLSHVAFCDAEAEFDLGTAAGQRSLLKMFRLAQLMVQYLFLSQEFLETQFQEAQEEAQKATEKYQEVKTKLLQQVEEAKKMKITNRNMRETVKYVNSFALANGIFQSLKCPMCPKTFRGQDFLHSHLWRKHPSHAPTATAPPVSAPQVTQLPSSSSRASGLGLLNGVINNVDNNIQESPHRNVTHAVHSGPAVPSSSNTNDVDAYRLTEIEKKFNAMNENFTRILREMQDQKMSLERENKKRQEEVRTAWEEKKDMEKGYENQLKRLNEQITYLQDVDKTDSPSPDTEKFLDIVRKQQEEIQALRAQVQRQGETDNKVVELQNVDALDGLSDELLSLKKQLNEQKKSHRHSLRQMKETLQKEYEEALQSEKLKLMEAMEDIAQKQTPVTVITQKPPPSPKTPVSRSLPMPNKATKPTVASLSPVLPQPKSKPNMKLDLQRMNAQDSESESETESETDTSRWNQSSLKVKQLQIGSPDVGEDDDEPPAPVRQRESEHLSEHSSEECSVDSKSPVEDESSDSLDLDTLLRDNPQLWDDMKAATSDVLTSKLSSFGLDPTTKGIKSDVLTSCLSHLRKERRKLEGKYHNFMDLRKRLENEIRAKVDDKIDNVEDISGIHPLSDTVKSKGKRGQSGVFSRVVKNVRSRVKEGSRALSSSVSKTSVTMKSGMKDMFHSSSKSDDDVKILSGKRRVSSVSVEKTNDEKDESSSDTGSVEDLSSARIEIHNETSKSVSRSLFGEEPIRAAGSGARPKQGNYFDNKTYGHVEEESESEWDSDPEYENVRKAEPPKRTDSLNLSVESADLHKDTAYSWDPVESKPIKLKKPSGEMVSNLTRTIESQLTGRRKTKPVGAVDVMGGDGSAVDVQPIAGRENKKQFLDYSGMDQSSPYSSQPNLQTISESSNTVRSSIWGSATAVHKVGQREPAGPSTSKGQAMVHSWDSEDDLDVSEIE